MTAVDVKETPVSSGLQGRAGQDGLLVLHRMIALIPRIIRASGHVAHLLELGSDRRHYCI